MEETKKNIPSFDLGFGFFLPLSPRKKKGKKEEPQLFACFDKRELHDHVEELKRSQQNIQQNTQ